MKIAWHIFRKDLRRLLGGLLLWSALYVVHFIAFRELRPFEYTTRGDVTVAWILEGLWVLEWITAWVLVALLVQGDSLCSDRAGWRTRPISGARLLGAKLLGLVLLFCVWPSLLTLPWWWQLGYPALEIVRLLAANALGLFLFAGLATLVAVLTPDLLRFLGWSCVLLVAGALAVFSISAELSAREHPVGLESMLAMRLMLVGGIAAVGVIAVIGLQYLRRAYFAALGVAAGTALVVALVAAFWPWSAATTAQKLGLAREPAVQVATRIDSVTLFVAPPGEKHKTVLEATFAFASELPGREGMMWRDAYGTLRYDDQGRLVVKEPLRPFWRAEMPTPATEMILSGRGEERRSFAAWSALRVELPSAIGPRLRAGEVGLHATVFGARWRGEDRAQMAFRDGKAGGSGFESLYVDMIRGATGNPAESNFIRWFEAGPWLSTERLMRLSNPSGAGSGWRDAALVVRAPTVTRYLQPDWRGERRGGFAEPVGALAVAERTSEFHPETKNGNASDEPADPKRFDDASLHWVVGQEVAPLTTALEVPRLVPDLIIEGDLAFARERARAEGKRLLMMTAGRDYDPAAQTLPSAWREPALRELLRTRFVCVQVFGSDALPLARRSREDRYPKFAIWTPEGALQDTWSEIWGAPRWLQALNAILEGRTYIEILRAEATVKPGDRAKESQLIDALLARGDVAEGVQRLLVRPEVAFVGWSQRGDGWVLSVSIGSLGWRLIDLAMDSGDARAELRAARQRSIAELQRDASNVEAGRRLLLTTFALQDAETWRAFPGLIPREAPERWPLLVTWVMHGDTRRSRPSTPSTLDWDEFYRESYDHVRRLIADVRQSHPKDALGRAYNLREQLCLLGTRSVAALVATGDVDRAQRLAVEVSRLAGYGRRDVRERLVNILRGKVPEATLREIRGR